MKNRAISLIAGIICLEPSQGSAQAVFDPGKYESYEVGPYGIDEATGAFLHYMEVGRIGSGQLPASLSFELQYSTSSPNGGDGISFFASNLSMWLKHCGGIDCIQASQGFTGSLRIGLLSARAVDMGGNSYKAMGSGVVTFPISAGNPSLGSIAYLKDGSEILFNKSCTANRQYCFSASARTWPNGEKVVQKSGSGWRQTSNSRGHVIRMNFSTSAPFRINSVSFFKSKNINNCLLENDISCPVPALRRDAVFLYNSAGLISKIQRWDGSGEEFQYANYSIGSLNYDLIKSYNKIGEQVSFTNSYKSYQSYKSPTNVPGTATYGFVVTSQLFANNNLRRVSVNTNTLASSSLGGALMPKNIEYWDESNNYRSDVTLLQSTMYEAKRSYRNELNNITEINYKEIFPGSISVISSKLPSGLIKEYKYDKRGNIISSKEVVGAGFSEIKRGFVEGDSVEICSNYRTCNNVSYSIDALNNRTDYIWNSDGSLKKLILPGDGNGVKVEKEYLYKQMVAPDGRSITVIDSETVRKSASENIKTTYIYDEWLRIVSETVSDGQVSRTTCNRYDDLDNLVEKFSRLSASMC